MDGDASLPVFGIDVRTGDVRQTYAESFSNIARSLWELPGRCGIGSRAGRG